MTERPASHSVTVQEQAGSNEGDPNSEAWSGDSILLNLVHSYDWANALRRIATHPVEATSTGIQGRTPLHIACDQDAPAVVVQALLKAFPEASVMLDTSNMNPLHITCSSQHASVHVVQVLLEGGVVVAGKDQATSMRDVDGDTPLHAACRCGAPEQVLEVLLRANPSVVAERDYEGLTPLLRLWVRYFVILGEEVINSVSDPVDLTGELDVAWSKTELLLRVARYCSLKNDCAPEEGDTIKDDDLFADAAFRTLHTAAAVDCPRAVVRIATIVYPDQLEEENDEGLLPLMIAAMAPTFKVHDLSDNGYSLEDVVHGDDDSNARRRRVQKQDSSSLWTAQPSVIQILAEACPRSASITCPSDRLPLHMALSSGKSWLGGVQAIMEAYPYAIMLRDPETGLYPFMLAAGKGADLDTIFEVLRSDPALLQESIIEDE